MCALCCMSFLYQKFAKRGWVCALAQAGRTAAVHDCPAASFNNMGSCVCYHVDLFCFFLRQVACCAVLCVMSLQVFVNAVSAVRRLAALLQLLGLPAAALHAQQQQRQRLKALDR